MHLLNFNCPNCDHLVQGREVCSLFNRPVRLIEGASSCEDFMAGQKGTMRRIGQFLLFVTICFMFLTLLTITLIYS